MAAKSLLLKIFSGPHVGAEVLLGDGEHVVGGDESCDVILNDQFIASRHAQITIAGETVVLSRWRKGFHADGDVLTIEQHGSLEDELLKADPKIRACVFATERLAELVQDVLRAIRFEGELQVSYPEPGKVVVAGEMTDLSPWHSTKRRIEQDVPELKELIDTVTLPKPGGPTRARARSVGVSKKNSPGQGHVVLVRHERVPAPEIAPPEERELLPNTGIVRRPSPQLDSPSDSASKSRVQRATAKTTTSSEPSESATGIDLPQTAKKAGPTESRSPRAVP